MEADVGWYQPCRVKQDDSLVPEEALCFVQPFHPGVMNIIYPYNESLGKMRRLKQHQVSRPWHGRYDRRDAASSSHHAPPHKSPRTG